MALDVVDQLVRSNAVDMVVVDSVAALVPRAELEGEMADMQMGLQARLMSKVRCGAVSLSRGCSARPFPAMNAKVPAGGPFCLASSSLWQISPCGR